MLMSGRIIPTIKEPPLLGLLIVPWNYHGTSGVSFNLQIDDQGLVEFDLSSWTHLTLISLCYSLGLCHSFKKCALSPSRLCHVLFLSPIWAHNVASIIFWRDNQKIAGPWARNTVKYPIPLDIQAFIFCVSYNMCNNSISQ